MNTGFLKAAQHLHHKFQPRHHQCSAPHKGGVTAVLLLCKFAPHKK